MVHDPRAPRLAALATLGAAVLVLLTALNLVFNLVGTTGLSMEDGAAGAGVVVLLVVAALANKEREIPELTSSIARRDVETFDALTMSRPEPGQTEVNPTTATILSSILGQQASADQQQVNAAIDTLSAGTFGDSVRQTIEAVEIANQKPTTPREAPPADETTGETLERLVVQSVPLPGQSPSTVVDQRSIPGLEPNRVFVTDGVKHVPLPTTQLSAQVPPTQTTIPPEASLPVATPPEASLPLTTPPEASLPLATRPDSNPPSTPPPETSLPQATTIPELPELPVLPDMLDLPDLDEGQSDSVQEAFVQPPTMELPDLDDLFAVDNNATPPTGHDELPELPELDDLF